MKIDKSEDFETTEKAQFQCIYIRRHCTWVGMARYKESTDRYKKRFQHGMLYVGRVIMLVQEVVPSAHIA